MLSLAQTIKDLKNNITNIFNTMAPKTYVDKKVADLVNGAPAQLDTLQELSKALNNDKDFGTTVNNAIAKKLNSAGGTITGNLTVNGTLTAKASTAGTADRALKADTCTGNAATASSVPWSGVTNKPTTFAPSAHNHAWSNITGAPATATRWPAWSEVSGKPTSFTPTIAAEVAGTAPAAGQIVRVNSLGALITNDLLKTVRAAGTDADISKLVAEPISMKEMFSNWQRISCSANGQNQNSNSSDQTTARACYYYDDNTRTIACPNNSDPFSAFVSSDSYAPDYRVKYQLTGRDGDDDGLCFIAGFMVDKAGKFHTLTVWRVGDNETQAPDPISDYKASSHQARFAICYDVYAAWMPQSPSGIVLARTVAPLKTDWYTKTCLCEVQKTSTQIIAKTADVNSTDMKYTLTFTLPSSKPADWPQEAYDNIKFMMQNSSQIGFGTQSNPCSFKILEQTGSITAITVYNVNTGKKLTYINGAKQSEVDDSNVLTPGCFLYSTITKKLFYVKNKDMVVLIDNGGEDILTNKNVVKNGTPTKDVSLRYETENGKNVIIPYVDGVKIPISTAGIPHKAPFSFTPLIDWATMEAKRNGDEKVKNIVNNEHGVTAYGGDTSFSYQKSGGENGTHGDIFLKQSYKNFDAILIHGCNDEGSYNWVSLWETWHLQYAFEHCQRFGINKDDTFNDHYWQVLGSVKHGTNNYTLSTDTYWSCYDQNCGIIEIYGLKF